MANKEYLKIGSIQTVDGITYVKRDYYDDGLSFGDIFKDEEAYENDWDEVCYIPECEFSDIQETENGYPLAEIYGYTHNDLLTLCNGNREWCDYLFHQLVWCAPETRINEMDESYFYRFIKPGAKVWWNDPACETSGEYEVYDVPFRFNEHGELTLDTDENYSLDQIVRIASKHSEAEVPVCELTPIYTDHND